MIQSSNLRKLVQSYIINKRNGVKLTDQSFREFEGHIEYTDTYEYINHFHGHSTNKVSKMFERLQFFNIVDSFDASSHYGFIRVTYSVSKFYVVEDSKYGLLEYALNRATSSYNALLTDVTWDILKTIGVTFNKINVQQAKAELPCHCEVCLAISLTETHSAIHDKVSIVIDRTREDTWEAIRVNSEKIIEDIAVLNPDINTPIQIDRTVITDTNYTVSALLDILKLFKTNGYSWNLMENTYTRVITPSEPEKEPEEITPSEPEKEPEEITPSEPEKEPEEITPSEPEKEPEE